MLNEEYIWECSENAPKKTVTVFIRRSITNTISYIEENVGEYEFSLFGNCVKSDVPGRYILDNVFFIPKQYVTKQSVEYDEGSLNLLSTRFNCVIHKHITNMRDFSYIDEKFLNWNTKFSLLWCDNSFTDGCANFSNEELGLIQIPVVFEYQRYVLNAEAMCLTPSLSKIIIK